MYMHAYIHTHIHTLSRTAVRNRIPEEPRNTDCACGSGRSYSSCCEQFHSQGMHVYSQGMHDVCSQGMHDVCSQGMHDGHKDACVFHKACMMCVHKACMMCVHKACMCMYVYLSMCTSICMMHQNRAITQHIAHVNAHIHTHSIRFIYHMQHIYIFRGASSLIHKMFVFV